MTKVLVCTTTSRVGPYSDMLKLYGDPDHYAYKFGNESFADRLPIHMHQIYTDSYDSYHSVTIDYGTQKVYYGDNSRQKLYHANYVHNITADYYYIRAAPETSQVIKPQALQCHRF